MRQFTDDKEIEIVKSNLSQCQSLLAFLGLDWVERELLQKKERSKVHALFWLLYYEDKSKKLQSWLEVLKDALQKTKFFGTLNKLRKYHGEIELYSLLSEIEVVSYYAKKGRVEYEPPRGDLKFSVNEHELHFEIAKLFSSEEVSRLTELSQLVWNKLDNISENKYVLSFRISPEFVATDVEPFVKHVRDAIAKKPTSFPSEEFPFEGDRASVTIVAESAKDKGHVGGSLISSKVETAARLKKKILNEASQLPEEGLNVVVYNIGLIGADFEDAETAFFGELQGRMYVNMQSREILRPTQWVRLENGAIHEEGGKKISALIVFKDFRYESRKLFPNPLATYPILPEIQSEI